MKSDYHIHTSYSDDSTFEMEEVVKLAIKIHLDEICFTDHVDYGVKRDWDDPKGILYKNDTVFMNVDYPSYMAQIAYLKEKYKDQIIIKAGMEFGMQVHTIPQYRRLFHAYPFDFIILSCHQVDDLEFWTYEFQQGKSQIDYNKRYYQEIKNVISLYKDYSVLGHLDLIVRYDESPLPFDFIKEDIKDILKIIIKDGKGLEVNTSSYRYHLNSTQPSIEILKLYKEMGGQIITIGSDSHEQSHLGAYIEETKALLKELGFTHFYTFKNMMPIAHAL